MKNAIIILVILLAALLTPSYSQWNEAYLNPGGFTGMYFLDSLNGWFTHLGTDKIIHTSDGGYTFDVQSVTPGQYTLFTVYMEDELNGWSAGQGISGGPGIIHHTTNSGVTWAQMNHPAPSGSGWAAIAKVGNSIWFCGTYGWPNNFGIIMKTSDEGQSWQVIEYPQFSGIGNIKVFDSLNVLISGATGLIARTTDGGITWVTANVPPYNVLDITFQDQNIGYCLVSNPYPPFNSYLYRTSDGGFTWNLHYSFGELYKRGMAIIPNTNIIFVTGMFDISIGTEGIIKSMDGGITWTPIIEVVPLTVYKIWTPDKYHGWALVSSYIYRYDYVTPVVVEPITNKLIQFGVSFTYQVKAIGLGLKYSMTGNPPGLSIGMYSGLIDGTPTQGGKFDITVAVKDTDANVVNEEFRLKVNRKPHFLEPFPPLVAYVDSLYQFDLNIEDLDDDTLNIEWLSKPSFLTFLEGITSRTISGIPTINDTGYHSIAIQATDGYGGLDTLS